MLQQETQILLHASLVPEGRLRQALSRTPESLTPPAHGLVRDLFVRDPHVLAAKTCGDTPVQDLHFQEMT